MNTFFSAAEPVAQSSRAIAPRRLVRDGVVQRVEGALLAHEDVDREMVAELG